MPNSLRVVAILFLIAGLKAAFAILFYLFMRNSIHINLSVIGLPIFFGLLRYSDRWRKIALLCLWVSMLLAVVAFIAGLFASGPARISLPGGFERDISPIWISVTMIPVFLLLRWQSKVLQRAEIAELFEAPELHTAHE